MALLVCRSVARDAGRQMAKAVNKQLFWKTNGNDCVPRKDCISTSTDMCFINPYKQSQTHFLHGLIVFMNEKKEDKSFRDLSSHSCEKLQ